MSPCPGFPCLPRWAWPKRRVRAESAVRAYRFAAGPATARQGKNACWLQLEPRLYMTPVGCDAGPAHVSSKPMADDSVSERLRGWTRNPMGSARRGSNPLGVEFTMPWQGCWALGNLSLSQEGDSELRSLVKQRALWASSWRVRRYQG